MIRLLIALLVLSGCAAPPPAAAPPPLAIQLVRIDARPRAVTLVLPSTQCERHAAVGCA